MRMRECLQVASTIAAIALLAAGCSSGGSQPHPTPSSKVTRVTQAQIKSARTSPKVLVPAGHWALVHRPKDDPIPAHTYLVRIAGVVKGKSGDLKKVRLMGPEQSLSMKTAVPYFVAFQTTTIKGDPVSADGPGVKTAIDKAHDDNIGILQNTNQFYNRCRPAPSMDSSKETKPNAVATSCVTVATAPGAQYAPTVLQVGLAGNGPAAQLKIPTAKLAD